MSGPLRALVTAGGTEEPIDDVRVLSNSSTGRFGAALATALAERGVRVQLLASRALAARPRWIDPRVQVAPFGSCAELEAALQRATRDPVDLLFMAAAVADYSPVPQSGKLSSAARELQLRLRRNPKLLRGLRARCGPDTTLCGFKLLSGVSSEELIGVARRQIAGAQLDICLANDLSELVGEQHPAWIVPAVGEALRVEGDKARTAAALAEHALAMRGLRPEPQPHGVVDVDLWARDGPADDALLDRLSDALADADRHIRSAHPELWIGRGWRRLRRGPPALLEPPGRRQDLVEAASICLYHRASDSVLLGERRAGAYPRYWSFPGGAIEEADANPLSAGIRELQEETGLELASEPRVLLSTELTVGTAERGWRLHSYAIALDERPEPRETEELAARWLPRADALGCRPMAPGTRRVLRRLDAHLSAAHR